MNLQEQLYRQIKQKEVGYNRSIAYFERNIKELSGSSERPTRPQYVVEKTKYGILGILEDIWGANEQKARLDYEMKLEEYEKKCHEYDRAQAERKRCMEQLAELNSQIVVFENACEEIGIALQKSRYNLEKMYAYNILYPKYRNYVMVSSLYEYFESGRCTKLEGHEGGYNILEMEIRLDRIITQLDEVIKNLAIIRMTQFTLYSCLQESNQKMNQLLQDQGQIAMALQDVGVQFKNQTEMMNAQLESLQKSSELSNYLAECNQRELHYMNRMNYLAGNYDNPYGNYAPV